MDWAGAKRQCIRGVRKSGHGHESGTIGNHGDKWDAKSRKGIFVGYSDVSKGLRIFIPDERKIEISRNIQVVDQNPEDTLSRIKHDQDDPMTTETEKQTNETVELQIKTIGPIVGELIPDEESEESQIEAEYDNVSETIRRGRGRPRIERTGRRGRPRKLFHDANFANVLTEMAYTSETPLDETTQGPDADEWLDAIMVELRSILKNDT